MTELRLKEPFITEHGDALNGLTLAYTTYGKLSASKDNVIWICHALTANSDPAEWWPGMVGYGKFFDPDHHFIVCVNMPGSCYGSTGPLSMIPGKNRAYFHDFPTLTNRDVVAAFDVVRQHLQINKIQLLLGGSLGGQQALEWAIMYPDVIQNLVLVATNAFHSPWGIAFNESQRMAISQDITWQLNTPEAGLEGLKVARSIALLSYRHYDAYATTQKEVDLSKTSQYKASSYQNYQGDKLVRRFNAYSYWILSCMMDSHQVARGRNSPHHALAAVKANTLVIGIDSDILFPVSEQKLLAELIPGATLATFPSDFGHDGFLIEAAKMTEIFEKELPFLINQRPISTKIA